MLHAPAPAVQEALKQVVSILDSPSYLSVLDAATAAVGPSGQVPTGSWPALAQVVVRYITEEVQGAASRKKGPEPALHRAFRLLMMRAEEGERRSGHSRLLLRRAGLLFRHVAEVLNKVGVTSGMGLDYSAVLRNQLLAVPEYCAASTPSAPAPPRPARRK